MKIEKVTIKNFRSIEYLELTDFEKCKIFVGEIEAGKSNILKALSFLDNDNMPSKKDQREPADDEIIKESYIDFDFIFTDDEFEDIYNDVKSNIYMENYSKTIAQINNKKLDLKKLCKECKGYCRINFMTETRNIFNFKFDEYTISSDLKKYPENVTELVLTRKLEGKTLDLSKYSIIDSSILSDESIEQLENIDFNELKELLIKAIKKEVNKKMPNVIFWEYNEKNLLPPKINLDKFAKNPNLCLPLKSMFQLLGITDIEQTIAEAKEKNLNSLRNTLKRVAKSTTKHFINVWPDYRNIEFSLEPDGADLVISIKDTYNHYDLSDRSDGFKRFVTFLLLISAKNKSKSLKNSVIIIDEPEISLHIKGQRHLRDELLNISKDNIVFYSTHSIFMIDKDNIDIHYIVKKQKEKTTIEQVNSSNYIDEEVIYNALGYSLFESLKDFNIVFEGWTDKVLFHTALSKIPAQYKKDVENLKSYGTCFSNGVKDIKSTCNILELIPRKYIVLSDSDKPARDKQLEFKKYNPNTWKRYDELYNSRRIITSEDFIKTGILYSELCKILKEKDLSVAISEQDIMTSPNGRIKLIENKLRGNKLEDTIVKNVLHDLKERIFNNLKQTHIEEDYYEFLRQLNISAEE